MQSPGLVAIAGAIGLLSLLLAACGGASSGDGPSGTAPGSSSGITRLSPHDYEKALASGDPFLVNVHVPYGGEIQGTDAFIPFDEIAQNAGALPSDKNAPLYIYCRSGRMSAQAAVTLRDMGYTNIADLAGGMEAWEAAGFPLVTRPNGG